MSRRDARVSKHNTRVLTHDTQVCVMCRDTRVMRRDTRVLIGTRVTCVCVHREYEFHLQWVAMTQLYGGSIGLKTIFLVQ